jgi:hypothetical protein
MSKTFVCVGITTLDFETTHRMMQAGSMKALEEG